MRAPASGGDEYFGQIYTYYTYIYYTYINMNNNYAHTDTHMQLHA